MSTAAYIIRCPSCGSGNRIPVEREGAKGRCGSCGAALPPLYRTPQQVNDRNFDDFVNDYPGPVLAEFWAPW